MLFYINKDKQAKLLFTDVHLKVEEVLVYMSSKFPV